MQLNNAFDPRDERGFTMITVMLCLFVLGLLSAGAIAAAQGDIGLSRRDQGEKQAYAAAEAGINDYLAHMSADPDYWTRCAGENSARPLTSGNAVNQKFSGAAPTTRKWRAVPGSNSRYSIELLPRPARSGETNPPTTCNVNDPAGSMVDSDGNISIRVTGQAGDTAATGDTTRGVKKAVEATFRRTSFLDYVYFTDYENMDPAYLTLYLDSNNVADTFATDANGAQLYKKNSDGTFMLDAGGQKIKEDDLEQWAANKCDRHWWGTQADGEGRAAMPTWRGRLHMNDGTTYPPDSSSQKYLDFSTATTCGEITFADADEVQGPFHSNDTILISGTPGFGRPGRNDRVEAPGYRGSGTPVFRSASGTLNTNASDLRPPPTNKAIQAAADPAYSFSGPTTIKLNGTTMDVGPTGGSSQTLPFPSNGVVYVDGTATGGCVYGYQPQNPTAVDSSCGQVRVSGTYSKDLTIAADDDVLITGNLTRSVSGSTKADAVLGLVANNFVRVWHPSCASGNPGATSNITIDAGILAVNHSFTVDNYNCGDPLGNLNITGAIAQKHRGVVGTGGSSITHGYTKNYIYDDRFQYRSPPYFLDPVQASWRVVRQNEQGGAR